jgi:hypothetical protein
MKKDSSKISSSKSSKNAETSTVDSVIKTTFRIATSWFAKLSAYCAAVAVAVVGVQRLPQKLGLSLGVCSAILISPIAIAFFSYTLPAILEKRRRDRLTLIHGTGKAGYFQLAPRADEESFQRADGKHLKVLAWLQQPPKRLLYLTGASGAGKSSLLAAWLIPKLERDGTKVIRLRGYQDPATPLETELRRDEGNRKRAPAGTTSLSVLLEEAHKRIRPSRLLIVFDQFEEFLILNEATQRARFLGFLTAEAEKQNAGVTILLVFREEYDGFIQELKLPTPISGGNLQKVSVFTEAAARNFLVGSGLSFDEKLQSSVLREAAEVEGTLGLIRPVTVNLCGLVLSRFALGLPRQFRPGRLIRGFVQESIFQTEIAEVTPLILPKLISAHVTKLPQSVSEMAKGTDLTPRQVQGAMFRLGDPERAIVRPLDPEQRVWEISHDFLVPMIDSMLAQWRSSLWKSLRQWLPAVAVGVLLAFVFAAPRLLPDPITDLSARGWTILPSFGHAGGGTAPTYSFGCQSCTTKSVGESLWDLRRLPFKFDITMYDVSTFDSTNFGGLAKLRNLRSLTIIGNERLVDTTALSNLVGLTSLELSGPRVSNAQLNNLPNSLSSLDLRFTRVPDTAVRGLPRNLKTLVLEYTGVSDAAMKDLPQGLTTLNLSFTRVTDVGLSNLPRSLQFLELTGTRVTDRGIAALPRSLVSLDLGDTEVTDAGIRNLPKALQTVDLNGTKVTSAGLERLPPSTKAVSLRPGAPVIRAAQVVGP